MKMHRRILLAAVLFSGIGFSFLPALATEQPAVSNLPETELDKAIYHFEHKDVPSWVYESDGAFFSDLEKGDTKRMVDNAADLVDKDFADGLKVRKIDGLSGFLIVFPKPTKMPQCFFAAALKDGDQYHYVTLELTEDLFNDGTKTCLCEWSSEGAHLNFGSRKYDDEASFLAELKERASKKSSEAAPAAITSPTKP